jgi:hypothetical protein
MKYRVVSQIKKKRKERGRQEAEEKEGERAPPNTKLTNKK